MAPVHGTNTDVFIDNGAGSLTDITGYLDSAGFELVRETVETSVFGATNKAYIPGLRDGKLEMGGPFDVAIDTIMYARYDAADTTSLNWYPAGNTTGMPKYAVECWVPNYGVTSDIGSRVDMSGTLQFTGNVTRTIV